MGKAKEDKVQLVLTALIFPVSFLIITFLGLDAVWVILGGLVTGVVYGLVQMRREKA